MLRIILLLTLISSVVSCSAIHLKQEQSLQMQNTYWSGYISDGDTIKIELDDQMEAHITYQDNTYSALWATLNGQDASLEGTLIACEPRYIWDISPQGNLGKRLVENILLKSLIHHDSNTSILEWKYDNNNIERKDTLFLKNK